MHSKSLFMDWTVKYMHSSQAFLESSIIVIGTGSKRKHRTAMNHRMMHNKAGHSNVFAVKRGPTFLNYFRWHATHTAEMLVHPVFLHCCHLYTGCSPVFSGKTLSNQNDILFLLLKHLICGQKTMAICAKTQRQFHSKHSHSMTSNDIILWMLHNEHT